MKKLNREQFAIKLWGILTERCQEDSEVVVINTHNTFKKIMAVYPEDFEIGNKVKVKVVNNSKLDLPTYASNGAACIDLCATFINKTKESFKGNGFDVNCDKEEKIIQIRLHAGGHILIPTGLFFELPHDYKFDIRPRSGLALKNKITVLNSPGTIDEDYRGEVGVILINHNDTFYTINHGDRIAQGCIEKVHKLEFQSVQELIPSDRGVNGFGSTGINKI